MTPVQIKEYTLLEAAALRLSEWDIEVEVVPKINEDDPSGTCDWFVDMHQSTIKIKAGMSDEETRWTIRHELIHLRLEGHRTYHKPDALYEWGINCISKVWASQ